MNNAAPINLEKLKKNCRAAAVGGYLWEDVLEDLTLWLNADRGLFLHSQNGNNYKIGLNYNHDLSASNSYNTSFNLKDPRERLSKRTPVGQPMTGQQYVSNQDMKYTDYYNQIIVKTDALDSLHTVLLDTAELGRHAISIHRSFKNNLFQQADIDKMQLVLPDLISAFSYSAKITGLVGAKLSAQSFGGLLNETLRPQTLSGNLMHVLMGCETLTFNGDFLRPQSKALSTFFSLAFKRALEGLTSQCQIAVEDPLLSEIEPFIDISISPRLALIDWLPSTAPSVLFHATRMQKKSSSHVNMFAEIFELTSAEQNILKHIVFCQSLRQAAIAASITYETARWHLKNIFLKTGYSKQASLIRAVRDMDISNAR